jgi:hypothetical protein
MSNAVSLFIKGADGYGWSERNYCTIDPAAGQAVGEVQALANARAGMLVSSATITHARFDTAVKRLVNVVPLNGGAGVPGTETGPSSPSEVAVLVEFGANGVGYNRTFLRGLPERISQADSYLPDDTFKQELQAYFDVLGDGNWNIQGTIGSVATVFPVDTLTPTTPRGYTFSSTTAIGLVVGNKVRMRGALIPGFNGIKTITKVSGTGPFVYSVGGAAPPVLDPSTAANIQLLTIFDVPIGFTIPIGLSRRAAGRPFGQSRGRRPTLYSLRR